MNLPSGQPGPDEDPGADPRLRARADLVWYLRHADALRRWPVLPEGWARAVEARRLGERAGRQSSGDGRRAAGPGAG